jgi:LMBR1 domain-containing protein 1
LSVSLTIYNVLLLPLDIANQGGTFKASGGLPMAVITESFFLTTVILAVVVVPFTMFYYEGMDEADDTDS